MTNYNKILTKILEKCETAYVADWLEESIELIPLNISVLTRKCHLSCESSFDLIYDWFKSKDPEGLSLIAHELTQARTDFITKFIEEGRFEAVEKLMKLIKKER